MAWPSWRYPLPGNLFCVGTNRNRPRKPRLRASAIKVRVGFTRSRVREVRARPVRDREVNVVGAGPELGADLPVGRDHDAEHAASEDGDREVVPVHDGLGLVQVHAHDVRVWALAGTAVPTRAATPSARATRVLRICQLEGSFRFGRVGAVGQERPAPDDEGLDLSGRLPDCMTRLSYHIICSSHSTRHHPSSRHAARSAEVPSPAGPRTMSSCTPGLAPL